MERTKVAEEFLKSLENPENLVDVMFERMDIQILYVINNYAELISRVKNKTSLAEKDIVSCSIIIGFLLKSHLDRYDLEQAFQT